MPGRSCFESAKNYAFYLLKFRQRSESELIKRLQKKSFEQKIIRKVLLDLKRLGLVDDCLFAKTWVESRIKIPLGIHRLKAELKLKGVDEKIIIQVLSRIKKSKDYNEERLVSEIANKKISKLKNLDSYKAKRRVYAYLLRRGFSNGAIIEAINRL